MVLRAQFSYCECAAAASVQQLWVSSSGLQKGVLAGMGRVVAVSVAAPREGIEEEQVYHPKVYERKVYEPKVYESKKIQGIQAEGIRTKVYELKIHFLFCL